MAKIYLSSTFSDLKECREALYRALRSLRHDVIAMEDYVATDQRPLEKCLADVEASDIYLGIFAWRYGYVPEKDNPEQRSITELEFRHAAEKGKVCLLFLIHEDAPWPRSKMDKGAEAEMIETLRREMSTDFMVSFFTDCEDLTRTAVIAVANWQAESRSAHVGQVQSAALFELKVQTSRLPITGGKLFGREQELKILDKAWADNKSHVLSLVAWGGVGKSALVNYWLARMAEDDYRGASKVYGWSFYSQGTTDRAVSADQFIEAVLTWFGDADPNAGSPWEKGERLARLVGSQRTLLVLDGLEPLQYPPGPDEGRLKDQSLQSLLRELAAHNEGLCVISTRVPVTDLSMFEGSTAIRIDLETLSPEAGAQVLRAQGVKGSQEELEEASKEFGGHSLALTLLGSYLSDVFEGDIKRRVEVKGLEEDIRLGRHAQKVMTSYERWFGEGPELAVLRILGLFNRPADKGSIDALRAAPAIPGLTDTLQGLSEPQWLRVLAKLRHAKLLAEPKSDQPGMLDTHPLVREHFGQQLKRTRPDAWREGNNRLYEHLKRTTKEFPDTIEEMTPLFAAVAHGCEAGRHWETFDEVFYRRILREKFFGDWVLGAYGAMLAALAGFFESPWQTVIAGINEADKAYILTQAGRYLKALGRLVEAKQPMQSGLEAYILQQDWVNSSINTGFLSELHLFLGDIDQALSYAQQSAEFANRTGDGLRQSISKTKLADALHEAGRATESEAAFREAEDIQRKHEPLLSILISFPGFCYCDLLLEQMKYKEVQERASQTLEWAKMDYGRGLILGNIALDHLSLGRAYLQQAQQENSDDVDAASSYLNLAVDGLREASLLDYLPRGLLSRAELHRFTGQIEQAVVDVDEAMAIAKRGSMGLYQADCHLEYARLYLIKGEMEKARSSWEKAKGMIERMGYHRRDKDVEEIEKQFEEV